MAGDGERFKRHADFAERRHAAGEYRPLLGGLDNDPSVDGAQSNPNGSILVDDNEVGDDFSESHTME
jgi:hypothetical protein